MKRNTKVFIYTVAGMLFLTSFGAMLIYGYKTFYIESDTNESKDYKYHFALIAEETENDYWRLIEKGAKKAAMENNIQLEYVAPQKADNEEMLRLLDRMIAAKVDGSIIQGIEGDRFAELVHKGNERHLPNMTIDTDVKSSERKQSIIANKSKTSQLATKSIMENMTREEYVGIVKERYNVINEQDRIAGFKEIIKRHPLILMTSVKEYNITEIGAAQ